MTLANTLRELGEFLEECENISTVRSVELTHESDSNGETPLTANVVVALSPDQSADDDYGLALRESTVDSEGGLRLTLESASPILPPSDNDVDVEVRNATFETDGSVAITLAVSMAIDEAPPNSSPEPESPAAESDETPTESTGRDLPPFRDPELLQDVYESCDTFEEMTDAIEMDVTAETVRRYMIDHGIHEPNSYDTAGEPDAEGSDTEPTETDDPAAPTDEHRAAETSPEEIEPGSGEQPTGEVENVYLADGMGLPDDVTAETLIETVKRSNTLHEVKRDLDMERTEVLDMLKKLDMVDLVLGSLGTESGRDISRQDVIERLRAASEAAA